MNITDDLALQFAIMLRAGLPAETAILYFTDSTDASEISAQLSRWTRSKHLQSAQLKLMGKNWQDMTLEEQIDCGLTQHYSTLAFLLWSTNYITVGANDKAKLDTARTALEAKRAGTSGQADPINRFFADFQAGKLKFNPQTLKASN